jgi:hypothetical protein
MTNPHKLVNYHYGHNNRTTVDHMANCLRLIAPEWDFKVAIHGGSPPGGTWGVFQYRAYPGGFVLIDYVRKKISPEFLNTLAHHRNHQPPLPHSNVATTTGDTND